jgi:hypothetical protein
MSKVGLDDHSVTQYNIAGDTVEAIHTSATHENV